MRVKINWRRRWRGGRPGEALAGCSFQYINIKTDPRGNIRNCISLSPLRVSPNPALHTPDLRLGRTGADPAADRDDVGTDGGSDDTGELEKSDSRSFSLISLRTLFARQKVC